MMALTYAKRKNKNMPTIAKSTFNCNTIWWTCSVFIIELESQTTIKLLDNLTETNVKFEHSHNQNISKSINYYLEIEPIELKDEWDFREEC